MATEESFAERKMRLVTTIVNCHEVNDLHKILQREIKELEKKFPELVRLCGATLEEP